MALITYEDKETLINNPVAEKYKCTAGNLNEIKNAINNGFHANTQWGTVPSGFSGSLPYIKIGNVVALSVMDYKTSTEISAHDTLLGSNLPKATTDIVFLSFRRDMSLAIRMRITTNGELRLHYSSPAFSVSNSEVYGLVVYTTTDEA